jgi:hypothetical protein
MINKIYNIKCQEDQVQDQVAQAVPEQQAESLPRQPQTKATLSLNLD